MKPLTDRSHATSNEILIIENDDRALSTLEELVRSEGFALRSTWSGREALAFIQSQPFILVLVGDHLPDIYYGEFIKLASRHAPPIVVIHKGRLLPSDSRRNKALGALAVVNLEDHRQLRQILAAYHVKPPSEPFNARAGAIDPI